VTITVRPVDPAAALPLRRRVLRPHQTVAELAAEDRTHADLVYFAAFDDDRVVAIASVCREAPPWAGDGEPGWRLRGMATDEGDRGRGFGAAALRAVIEYVAAHGGDALWCSARLPAVGFYERARFRTRGESWVDPVLGPHIMMERSIRPE
jgi:GNAT superfamily N-acetyltransferase